MMIRPHESALSVDPEGELRLVLPDTGDDGDMPDGALPRAPVLIRAGYDAWLAEMAASGKMPCHGDLQRLVDEFVSQPG